MRRSETEAKRLTPVTASTTPVLEHPIATPVSASELRTWDDFSLMQVDGALTYQKENGLGLLKAPSSWMAQTWPDRHR